MCSKSILRTITQKIVFEYQNVYGSNLVNVYLYGSYARGDYDEDSDIDLVAIVKGTREELQNQLKNIWDISSDLELEYEVIISPTVIPFDEFEQYKEDLPYYKNIEKEGVKLIA